MRSELFIHDEGGKKRLDKLSSGRDRNAEPAMVGKVRLAAQPQTVPGARKKSKEQRVRSLSASDLQRVM